MVPVIILFAAAIALATLAYLTFIKLRKENSIIRNLGAYFLTGCLALASIVCVSYLAHLSYIKFFAVAKSANNVALDDSVSDVVFILGEPDNIDTWREFERYIYTSSYGSGEFYVFFDESKVARIHLNCFSPSVIGISCRQNVSEVTSLIGQPDSISSSGDKTERIYNYPEKNLSIFLERGKVTALSIAKDSDLQFIDNTE